MFLICSLSRLERPLSPLGGSMTICCWSSTGVWLVKVIALFPRHLSRRVLHREPSFRTRTCRLNIHHAYLNVYCSLFGYLQVIKDIQVKEVPFVKVEAPISHNRSRSWHEPQQPWLVEDLRMFLSSLLEWHAWLRQSCIACLSVSRSGLAVSSLMQPWSS